MSFKDLLPQFPWEGPPIPKMWINMNPIDLDVWSKADKACDFIHETPSMFAEIAAKLGVTRDIGKAKEELEYLKDRVRRIYETTPPFTGKVEYLALVMSHIDKLCEYSPENIEDFINELYESEAKISRIFSRTLVQVYEEFKRK